MTANLPLTGKKILITRAREQSAGFAAGLRELGAKVLEFPTIEILPPLRWDALDRSVDRLTAYDWVIFTSANGVKFFWQRLEERKKDLSLPPDLKVCAIGPATAKKLKEKRARIDYVPEEYVAEAILKGFEGMPMSGNRILLARARVARDVLPNGLRQMGAKVDVAEVYRTVKPKGGARRLRQLFSEDRIDVVTFTSSSTVTHFGDLLKKEDLRVLLRDTVIASIGPITTRTATQLGLGVQIQPEDYTIPALTQAIVNYFNRSYPPPLSPLKLRGEEGGSRSLYLPVALADLPGTLPTPWNAGLVDIGGATQDFTKSEFQQRQRTVVLDLQRFRSKAYSSVPGRSVMELFLQR